MNAAWPRRVSLIIAGRLPAIPSPTIGATTGVRPAASGLTPAPTGFASHSKARPSTPTESSSLRMASRPPCVTDWSFSFRCSPPRIAATQLRFDTARLFAAQERTSTAPSSRLLRRTSADGPRPQRVESTKRAGKSGRWLAVATAAGGGPPGAVPGCAQHPRQSLCVLEWRVIPTAY